MTAKLVWWMWKTWSMGDVLTSSHSSTCPTWSGTIGVLGNNDPLMENAIVGPEVSLLKTKVRWWSGVAVKTLGASPVLGKTGGGPRPRGPPPPVGANAEKPARGGGVPGPFR